jgi:hypothetical protein
LRLASTAGFESRATSTVLNVIPLLFEVLRMSFAVTTDLAIRTGCTRITMLGRYAPLTEAGRYPATRAQPDKWSRSEVPDPLGHSERFQFRRVVSHGK